MDKILEHRYNNEFSEVCRITELLKDALKEGKGWKGLDNSAKVGMFEILQELAVCVCSAPTSKSLLDIQGYAECILKTSKSVVANVENKAKDNGELPKRYTRKDILDDLFAQLYETPDWGNKFIMTKNVYGKLGFAMFRQDYWAKVFYIMKIGDCENVFIYNCLCGDNVIYSVAHMLKVKHYLANTDSINDRFNQDFLKYLVSLKESIFERAKNAINQNHRDVIKVCEQFNIEIHNEITELSNEGSMKIPFVNDKDLYFTLLKKVIYADCFNLHKSLIANP